MDVSVSQEQGRVPVSLVRVTGRVNLGTADQLKEAAQHAIAGGARHMLIDLSGVESITSAGLRVIHAIYKLLPGNQPSTGGIVKSPYLKLLNPSAPVRKIIEIAGFDTFLEIHEDARQALSSFG